MTERARYLATTEWLGQNLDRPNLRILECTVFLRPRDDGQSGYAVVSGRDEWATGHIPQSVFADIPDDLSDRSQALRFMIPSAEQFAAAMGRYGVGDASEVVLYDRAGNMWAARVWWMLRAFGFDNARILDGGWQQWSEEGRPVSTSAGTATAAQFSAELRPGLIATKDDVLKAMASGQACIVNALSAAQHRGDVAPYGRPGHITGSVNVPAMGAGGIVDPQTQLYHPVSEIQRRFKDAGVHSDQRVITYCGGGIAASSAAFAAIMAGYADVAVYDASLSEWAADRTLPMETSSRA
jgi:thiosulfate/3-mercaptopyruvate sulfurtransferase